MPRALRLQYPGAWYHVMNRGASRRSTFLDPQDRRRFLELTAECVDLLQVEVHSYCLMGNHFHLLLRTPQPNLDQVMHRLCSKYVRSFNKRHDFDGPLCRSRYKAIPVQSEDYLVSLGRYIHRNPIDLGVEHLGDYPWSSYPAYLGAAATPEWLSTDLLLRAAGGRNGHAAFVESRLKTEIDLLYEDGESPLAIGDPAFVAQFAEQKAGAGIA